MNKEDRFESIRIDLRPFGWGIRDVGVIWPDDHQGGGEIQPGVPIPRDTVDSEAIQDGAVQMEDLNDDVKDKMMTDDDRVTQEDINNFNV